MSQTGLTMVLKAMGFDPQMIIDKGQELEAALKLFGEQIQTKVETMDARLTNIELMLAGLSNRVQAADSATIPAGETSSIHLQPNQPQPLLTAVPKPEETNTHGRYARNRSTVKVVRGAGTRPR